MIPAQDEILRQDRLLNDEVKSTKLEEFVRSGCFSLLAPLANEEKLDGTEIMEQNKSSNIVWHHASVTRERRETLNGHRSAMLWFTGLSGAGKSTLAHAVEEQLYQMGCRTFTFDGDNVRHGLVRIWDFHLMIASKISVVLVKWPSYFLRRV